jgi:hypothetical protein
VGIETKYAKSEAVNIAYQVIGDGPIDLVFVMGWISNLDYFWEEPHFARFLRRLGSFSRLILFDKRGTGVMPRYDAVGEFRSSSKRGEVRLASMSTRSPLEPGSEAGHVQCRRSGDMLDVRFRQPVVAGVTKLERTNSL